MVANKFLHLKDLDIYIGGDDDDDDDDDDVAIVYDFLSLISFLDACPALESFALRVSYFSMFVLQVYLISVVET
jgi:hypothetical protein